MVLLPGWMLARGRGRSSQHRRHHTACGRGKLQARRCPRWQGQRNGNWQGTASVRRGSRQRAIPCIVKWHRTVKSTSTYATRMELGSNSGRRRLIRRTPGNADIPTAALSLNADPRRGVRKLAPRPWEAPPCCKRTDAKDAACLSEAYASLWYDAGDTVQVQPYRGIAHVGGTSGVEPSQEERWQTGGESVF